MSQCPHCREPIAAKDERCPHCGAAIAISRPADAASLENAVLALTRQGEKIQAIKLYREQTGMGLAEAKAAVESISRGDTFPVGPSLDGKLERQILELMAAGRKIEAVKLHRERTNSGLKESKDAVEELAARHGIAPIKTGCLGVAALLLSGMFAAAASLCVCLSATGNVFGDVGGSASQPDGLEGHDVDDDAATAHDSPYQRGFRSRLNRGVYKAQIRPNWFPKEAGFWYRNDLSGRASEYVVVDVVAGEMDNNVPPESTYRLADRSPGFSGSSSRIPFRSWHCNGRWNQEA